MFITAINKLVQTLTNPHVTSVIAAAGLHCDVIRLAERDRFIIQDILLAGHRK